MSTGDAGNLQAEDPPSFHETLMEAIGTEPRAVGMAREVPWFFVRMLGMWLLVGSLVSFAGQAKPAGTGWTHEGALLVLFLCGGTVLGIGSLLLDRRTTKIEFSKLARSGFDAGACCMAPWLVGFAATGLFWEIRTGVPADFFERIPTGLAFWWQGATVGATRWGSVLDLSNALSALAFLRQVQPHSGSQKAACAAVLLGWLGVQGWLRSLLF